MASDKYIKDNEVKCQIYASKYISFILSRKKLNEKRNLDNIITEVHHILPRSMGGTNDKENLVRLTLREHFIAHAMLLRIYKNSKMSMAFKMMCSSRDNNLINSKVFEKHKQKWYINICGELNPMYGKVGKLSPLYGFKHSEESKLKMSIWRKNNCTGENNGFYGKKHNKNTLEKLSNIMSKENNPMYDKVLAIDEYGNKITISKEEYKTGKYKTSTTGNNNPKYKLRKKVSINGKIYNSLKEAALDLNIPSNLVTKRCKSKSKNFEQWIYIGN